MVTSPIHTLLSELIQRATDVGLIEVEDQIYVRNQLFGLLRIDTYQEPTVPPLKREIPDVLNDILDYAIGEHLVDHVFSSRDIFSAKLMNVFVPRPSHLSQSFYEKYKESPEAATHYFYDLSIHSHYIQMDRIKKILNLKQKRLMGPWKLRLISQSQKRILNK